MSERPWHGLVAGCVAGAAGVIVGHAFDTAKVQSQVGSSAPTKRSMLYRGILPPLLTTGAMRALYFGVYEALRPPIALALGERDGSSLRVVFATGAATGLATAPVTAPMQRLKLIQQVQGGGLLSVLRGIVATSGARGLFRGLGLHCALETVGSACYLTAYRTALKWSSAPGAPPSQQQELPVRIGCGAVGGICGWLSIYPLDVLRSRVMSAPAAAAVPAGGGGGGGAASARAPAVAPSSESLAAMVTKAASETYASGGVRAFYRGLSFTLMRAAPVAGIVLPVYDLLKRALAGDVGTDRLMP